MKIVSQFNVVKQEHVDKLKRLEKENQELQEVKKNWKSLEGEYKSKLLELEREKSKLELNAKRMRLEELFEGEFNTILYRPDCKYVQAKKCDKCDDKRKIKFYSPSGKEMKEDCDCAKTYKKWEAKPYYCAEFRVNRHRKQGEMPLLMWYKKYHDYSNDYDGYKYDGSDLIKKIYSPEMEFGTIYEDFNYSIYFKNEEDCKRYCNWLNDKAGITNDMATSGRY